MKKVLCDKDGKFLSVHDGDCILAELEDGNCLTHEDGTILIYRKCEREDIKMETRLPIMTLSRLTDFLHQKKRSV